MSSFGQQNNSIRNKLQIQLRRNKLRKEIRIQFGQRVVFAVKETIRHRSRRLVRRIFRRCLFGIVVRCAIAKRVSEQIEIVDRADHADGVDARCRILRDRFDGCQPKRFAIDDRLDLGCRIRLSNQRTFRRSLLGRLRLVGRLPDNFLAAE